MNSVSEPNERAKSASTPEVGSAPPTSSPAGPPPESESPSDAFEPPPDPLLYFALRSDGAILLNAADLKGFNLSGREVFVGVVLTPRETRAILVRLGHAAADAAAKLLGVLRQSLSRLHS